MEYVLEMKDISKTFPGVVALDHVQLQVRPGEVHALMGENGAGKSTLMKILMGIYTKDAGGEILFAGKPYTASNPKEAMDMGVAMIHQELNPILDMTVYENIFVGRELRKNGLVDKKAEIEEAQKLIEECGLHVSPRETLRNLTVAQCQLIEIIKAISVNAKVIIMDEPTAAITEREVEILFNHIRKLKEKGVAIIYISHRMAEIFSICDRVSVYRDGQYIGTDETKNLDEAKLIKMMVGREITDVYPKLEADIGEVIFEARNIVRADHKVKGVSLAVRRGEILGIGGLVGAGRSELVEGIFGIHPLSEGEIFVKGKKIRVNAPQDIIREGVALITEDRKVTGLNLSGTVNDNIAMVAIKKLLKHGLYDKGTAYKASQKYVEKLKIKTPSVTQIVGNLSGGNQQKILSAAGAAGAAGEGRHHDLFGDPGAYGYLRPDRRYVRGPVFRRGPARRVFPGAHHDTGFGYSGIKEGNDMKEKKRIGAFISEYFIFVIFIALVVVLTCLKPSFITPGNLVNILKQASINGILAFGMMFVIVAGGFDMSVGSTVAFTGILAAMLGQGDYPLIVPLVVAMLAGLAVGIVNGVGVAVGNLPPFIMTLGTMTAVRGLALVVSKGKPVIGISAEYKAVAASSVFGIPMLAVFLAVIIAVCSFVLSKTVYGRRVYACGGNLLAARVSGINTTRIRISTFAIAGLLAGLSGFLMTSRVTIGQPTAAESYEMDAITACVVGGVSMSGGVGKPWGVVVGCLLITVIANGLDIMGVSSHWQRIVKGAIIVLAVLIDIKGKSKKS